MHHDTATAFVSSTRVSTPSHPGLVRGTVMRLRQRPLLTVAALALAIQLVSAARRSTYVMPNAALVIASNVADSGRYEGGSWLRLKGTLVPTDPPLRSYHLPGEPLYLAAGLALHRPSVFAYWHVPVAVLLIVAAAAAAGALFGPEGALVAGVIAAVDPLMAVHGPVYDDTFLGAALFWFVVAVLLRRWADVHPGEPTGQATSGFVSDVAVLVAAGWAAVTRSEALIALVGLTLCCLALPSLRSLRRLGAAVGIGLLLAVGTWTARNAIVQGHLLIGSSHDGITLWESNEAHAPQALALGQVDGLSADPAIVGAIWRQTVARDEVGANRVFVRAAVQDMAAHPLRVAAFAARKVATSITGVRPELPLLAARNVVSILATALLIVMAALGWSRQRRRRPDEVRAFGADAGDLPRQGAGIAAMLLALEALGVLALGPVGVRYWVIWRPVLWVMAGLAVVPIVRRSWVGNVG
jgi:hypothetical protein